VRLDLLPAFRSLHPAAEANLLRTAALLADDDAAFDALARELLLADGSLATAAVADAPAAVVLRALRRAAGFPAARPVAAARVSALARSRSGAGAVPLGAGRTAERRYERIVIVRGELRPLPVHEIALAVPGETPFGELRVRCALASDGRALDASLAPALVLRAAREGERLPGARRTIARMLLESHVPRSERAGYPVVSAHGEPVAVPGIAVAPALRRPTGLVLTLAAT
jgi:tRNA(Ile)-lysidine synthase